MCPGARTPPTEPLKSVSPVKTAGAPSASGPSAPPPSRLRTRKESIPTVCPGVCRALTASPPISSVCPAVIGAGRAGWAFSCAPAPEPPISSPSRGSIRASIAGQRPNIAPSSHTWSKWWWVEQDVAGPESQALARLDQRLHRASHVDEERLPSLRRGDEIGVGERLGMQRRSTITRPSLHEKSAESGVRRAGSFVRRGESGAANAPSGHLSIPSRRR